MKWWLKLVNFTKEICTWKLARRGRFLQKLLTAARSTRLELALLFCGAGATFPTDFSKKLRKRNFTRAAALLLFLTARLELLPALFNLWRTPLFRCLRLQIYQRFKFYPAYWAELTTLWDKHETYLFVLFLLHTEFEKLNMLARMPALLYWSQTLCIFWILPASQERENAPLFSFGADWWYSLNRTFVYV